MNQQEKPPYLSIPAAAARLCLSRVKVHQLVRAGYIRGHTFQGCTKILIAREELDRYINSARPAASLAETAADIDQAAPMAAAGNDA